MREHYCLRCFLALSISPVLKLSNGFPDPTLHLLESLPYPHSFDLPAQTTSQVAQPWTFESYAGVSELVYQNGAREPGELKRKEVLHIQYYFKFPEICKD